MFVMPFHFTVRDGAFHGEGGLALVYEVIPAKAFGFGKGESFSQTRWRFCSCLHKPPRLARDERTTEESRRRDG